MCRGRVLMGMMIAGLCFTACGGGNVAQPEDTAHGLSPHAAVAQVLASLGDPMVRAADVIPDPSDNPGGLPWVRVRVDSNAGDGTREVWLGELVEGAVGELIRTNQSSLGEVLGAEIVDRGPHGRPVVTPLGMGSAPVGLRFDSPTDTALRERVAAVADKYGLKVSSVEVLHPLDSALAVTFTVPPGGVSWTASRLSDDLAGSPVDVEGVFMELDSPSERPLLRGSRAERVKGGGLWFAPGQDRRFGVLHG